MPLVPASGDAVLLERRRSLRKLAAHHKAEARRTRHALQQTMSQLTAIDEECRRRGLSPGEEGDALHGHRTEAPTA